MHLLFSTINLGCFKNLVETQHIIGHLLTAGQTHKRHNVTYCPDPYDPEVRFVFVNTCGFLSSGREEMIGTLRTLLKTGKCVYVLGCAVQYFEQEKKRETNLTLNPSPSERDLSTTDHPSFQGHVLPSLQEKGWGGGLDESQYWQSLLTQYGGKLLFLLARSDIDRLTIDGMLTGRQSVSMGDFEYTTAPRAYTNAHLGFEYVKIAEGCNNACSFCIIPKLRGKQKSRPIEEIVRDVQDLVATGVSEIILLAQDTTRYGIDLYGKYALLDLVHALEAMKEEFTYRILYLYPDVLTQGWLEELAICKKFIPYFDIPFQHVSPSILQRMGRRYGSKGKVESEKGKVKQKNDEKVEKNFSDGSSSFTQVANIVQTIRSLFPVSYIRTNFIIGFPGETEVDHLMLLANLRQGLFDNVALFEYHDEPLAASSKFADKVDEKVIRQRFLEARKIIEAIKRNRKKQEEIRKDRGYVVDIKEKTARNGKKQDCLKIIKLIIRPWLHAPDIDATVEVSVEHIVAVLDGGGAVEIGSRVRWGLV